MAKALAASGGKAHELQQLAHDIPSPRVHAVIEGRHYKAAISVGTLTSDSAIAAYQQLSTGFFGSLSEFSAYSKIYSANDFYKVPLRTVISVLSTAPTAEYTAELSAKPMSSASFGTATLDVVKCATMIAITRELAFSSAPGANQQFSAELRRAASIAVDQKFLALMAATPGITTAATTGITASAILLDLTAALNRLTIGADSRLWFICSPKVAKTVSLLQGTGGYILQNNKIGAISIAPSDAATTTGTLLDSKGIATELDIVAVDSVTQASVQLDSDPTSGAYQLVSLWASDMVGLRCEVAFGAVATRSTSVTTITGYAA